MLWALLDTPSHFRTDTPSQALWDSPIITQHITYPSKPFLNRHTNPSPVIHSCHPSTYYLPPQVILEPTSQAKTCEKGPVIPHHIACPSKPFLNRHGKPSAMRQSRHSPTDYLPLQAIFEPTSQATWSSHVIPHWMHHSSMTHLE